MHKHATKHAHKAGIAKIKHVQTQVAKLKQAQTQVATENQDLHMAVHTFYQQMLQLGLALGVKQLRTTRRWRVERRLGLSADIGSTHLISFAVVAARNEAGRWSCSLHAACEAACLQKVLDALPPCGRGRMMQCRLVNVADCRPCCLCPVLLSGLLGCVVAPLAHEKASKKRKTTTNETRKQGPALDRSEAVDAVAHVIAPNCPW